MTDNEIDAVSAGAQLDALIEQHIFNRLSADVHIDGRAYYLGGVDGHLLCPIPGYSTQILAAWPLVEQFKMTITPKTDQTPTSKWLVDVRLCAADEPWLAYGPTVPLAICRCALKTIARSQAVIKFENEAA